MIAKLLKVAFKSWSLLLVTLICAASAYAQAVCPVTTLRVAAVSGRVMTRGRDNDEPLAQAKVELRRLDERESLVASTRTDGSGYFKFGGIKRGQYLLVSWLTVGGEAFSKYAVRLNVRERAHGSKSERHILVRLGVDCFSSEAGVIQRRAASNNGMHPTPHHGLS